jgi:predicted esterase
MFVNRLSPVLLALAASLAACSSDSADDASSGTDAGADTGMCTSDSDCAPGGSCVRGGCFYDDTDAGLADTGTIDAAPDVPAVETTPLRAYSGGSCPALEDGRQGLETDGVERDITLFLPPDPAGAGVVFIWHGAGDTASNMARAFGAQDIADEYNVIAVVPTSMGFAFEWPILAGDDEDAGGMLFDDVLACLEAQYDIDNTRIYSTGFSAGALWTTWLLMNRAEYLAAALPFSGGTDASIVLYSTPAEAIPVLAVHGGASDTFAGFVNFRDMTEDMVDELLLDGHPVIVCDHGRGHTVPFDPFDWAFPWLFAQAVGAPDMPSQLDDPWPSWCELL